MRMARSRSGATPAKVHAPQQAEKAPLAYTCSPASTWRAFLRQVAGTGHADTPTSLAVYASAGGRQQAGNDRPSSTSAPSALPASAQLLGVRARGELGRTGWSQRPAETAPAGLA